MERKPRALDSCRCNCRDWYARRSLYETVMGAGLVCLNEVPEAKQIGLYGARYKHLSERNAPRAGHVASSSVLCGTPKGG